VRLLRALRAKGILVLALSNFGVHPFEQAQNHYGFLSEFDERYISGHLQIIKPDPQIYAALEEGSGYAPKGLLFADDLPQNIAAAAARGWQTHLFKDADGWADCLVSHGLLSAAEAQ
jgi:2-haloacid dehalogenase